MEKAFGLEIPQSLEEACDPRKLALLVYDMPTASAYSRSGQPRLGRHDDHRERGGLPTSLDPVLRA